MDLHSPPLHVPSSLDLPFGTVAARVVRVDRTGYDVLTPDGPARVPVTDRPDDLRDGTDVPTVGDWLAVGADRAPVLLPRRGLLARGAAAGTSTVQPLAANVDVVLVCAGLHAAILVRRVERLLTLAWDSGATPVVLLTKADLCADVPGAVRTAQRHAPGVDVVVVAAEQGDVRGLAPYTGPGTTLVLLGASGTGKSTVVNALLGAPVMATGATRQVDGKGRHTTTHRELLQLPGGAVVIDTPGLRAIALQGGPASLALAFRDVEDLAVACRFADCGHVGEPGCAVRASVEAGDVAPERVESWRRLQRELAFQARRTDVRLRAEERQRWRAVAKGQRARGGRP